MRNFFLVALILVGFNGVFVAQILWGYLMWQITKQLPLPGGTRRSISAFGLICVLSLLISGVGAHLLDPGSEPWFVLFVLLGAAVTSVLTIALVYWSRRYAAR